MVILFLSRGGSNSIVLQYYCKVLQYFGIVTSQSIVISIAKSQIIAILIVNFSSIAKSIANIFKYWQKYCKHCQVLQKVLQTFSSIAKSIAIFFKYCKKYCKIWKYCKKYCKIQKYCKKYCKISRSGKKFQLWYSLLNFDW